MPILRILSRRNEEKKSLFTLYSMCRKILLLFSYSVEIPVTTGKDGMNDF